MEDLKKRVPSLLRNPISLLGVIVILVSLANIIFLILVDVVSTTSHPYLGIFAYMILPGFLIGGMALVPAGMWWERRRRRKLTPEEIKPLTIDFSIPKHRNTIAFLGSFFVVFGMLSAVGSYRAYEYTDSVQFCGQLCHSVMAPEFAAYLESPHARVRCVDCHVGPGAGWYVRSKMSGLRQVYFTATAKFPRPIPTPVENLRPAQDTCEQCHWPEKFHGSQFLVFNHFGSDQQNTPRAIKMLVKTGGGSPEKGITTGIHWHMNIANEVTYIATDKRRQVIPYIRVKDMQGRITEYLARDSQLKPEEIQKHEKRRMDCVDCHNRPTHIYVPPADSVDRALLAGNIDRSLPFIKAKAVEVMTKEYKTTEEAMEGIATGLDSYYQTEQKAVYQQKHPAIKQAISEVQRLFKISIFPEMKLDWRTHPNNIGHMYSAGCFRCHDGNHVSKEGVVLSKGCDTCHEIVGQEENAQPLATLQVASPRNPKDKSASATSLDFQHPGGDLGDPTQVNCADCHTGGGM